MKRFAVLMIAFLALGIWMSACSPAATQTVEAPTAAAPAATATLVPATATLQPTSTTAPTATQAPSATPALFSFTDVRGNKVTLAQPAQRIISLAPSNTEILYAVGAGAQVVARDDFSNYPAEAAALPTVGGSMTQYNLEEITKLQPDLLLVSPLTSPEQIKALQEITPNVYVLENPKTLDELYANLVMVGAETGLHYAGDLSSTFPVDQQFTSRQNEIYQISLDAHEAALAKLAPGVPFREVHFEACRTIFNGLKDLGLTKGDTEEAIAEGAHAMFFPCGTGHMMGLDVHDMENLGEVWVGYAGEPKSTLFGIKSLRLARPLEPGFVATIEPGIYFIPELIDYWRKEQRHMRFLNYDKIEAYKNFSGVRNEEDVLITSDGYRLLGKQKPKTIAEVEALRQ